MPRGCRCCSRVIPQNAARRFKNPAEILNREIVRSILAARRGSHVLEIGSGALRNALYLQRLEHKVTVLEVRGIENFFPKEYQRFRQAGGQVIYAFTKSLRVDFALATFVIEAICQPEVRENLLRGAFAALREGGALILSVRGPADIVTATAAGVRCSDGYVTPNRTFARSYTKLQLAALLKKCGFRKIEFLHRKAVRAPEIVHAVAWRDDDE
jgi:SAM-dependent methyltransferase